VVAGPTVKLPAVASFFPLQDVTRRVGGDRVETTNLVAAGGEPHDLELTPRDIERLRQARLLVYLGAGFQPSLEKALQATQSPALTTVNVIEGMTLLEAVPEDEDEPQGPSAAGDMTADPHVWLDPLFMKDVATRVRDALIRLDSAGRVTYEGNTQAYQAELDALDRDFRAGLQNCRRRDFVTSHTAFAYLAKRYGLEQKAIAGLSPENEPSPQRMQEVVRYAREHNAKVIYFETLVEPRVAETIAREVGAKTLVLNPIEGLTPEEQAAGKSYRDLMRQNLENLKVGLECS
jgi:zinc transport system substrate-binding protein